MATRLKAKASASAPPQTRSDCAAHIRTLGDMQRTLARQRAQMNDAIAEITQLHEPVLQDLQSRIEALMSGIQTWCEANRVALCGEGDRLGKTANLVTGEVSWRLRPPSVVIRGADSVVDTLLRHGLERYVRTTHVPNKEQMLADPEGVRGIAGVSIQSGLEDFIVVPFEAQPTSTEVAP